MWPFMTDARLRTRLKALETRCDDLEHALGRASTVLKESSLSFQRQLDAQEDWVRKISGKVYGRAGAESSAAKAVPTKTVDKMSKNELRAYAGLSPGKPAPKVEPQQVDIEEG